MYSWDFFIVYFDSQDQNKIYSRKMLLIQGKIQVFFLKRVFFTKISIYQNFLSKRIFKCDLLYVYINIYKFRKVWLPNSSQSKFYFY